MSNEFSKEQVARELREIVLEEPDRRAVCTYVTIKHGERGTETIAPECIVGQWLVRKRHISPSSLIKDNGTFVGNLMRIHGIPLSEEAKVYLSIVQGAQDENITWRKALDVADGAFQRIDSFA